GRNAHAVRSHLRRRTGAGLCRRRADRPGNGGLLVRSAMRHTHPRPAEFAAMNDHLEVCFEKRFPGGVTIEAEWRQPADAFSITVLSGPSGCGKTIALRSLAG